MIFNVVATYSSWLTKHLSSNSYDIQLSHWAIQFSSNLVNAEFWGAECVQRKLILWTKSISYLIPSQPEPVRMSQYHKTPCNASHEAPSVGKMSSE